MVRRYSGCGYCKQCLRIRTLSAIGREPDRLMQCEYQHILDSFAMSAKVDGGVCGRSAEAESARVDSSCQDKCRWTSTCQFSSEHSDWSRSDLSTPSSSGSSRRRRPAPNRKKV